eukprot:1656793-Rhodomonas_salina.5
MGFGLRGCARLAMYSKDSSTKRRGSMSSSEVFDPTCSAPTQRHLAVSPSHVWLSASSSPESASAAHVRRLQLAGGGVCESERECVYHGEKVALAELRLLRAHGLELLGRDHHDRRVQPLSRRPLARCHHDRAPRSAEEGEATCLSGVVEARIRVRTLPLGLPARHAPRSHSDPDQQLGFCKQQRGGEGVTATSAPVARVGEICGLELEGGALRPGEHPPEASSAARARQRTERVSSWETHRVGPPRLCEAQAPLEKDRQVDDELAELHAP